MGRALGQMSPARHRTRIWGKDLLIWNAMEAFPHLTYGEAHVTWGYWLHCNNVTLQRQLPTPPPQVNCQDPVHQAAGRGESLSRPKGWLLAIRQASPGIQWEWDVFSLFISSPEGSLYCSLPALLTILQFMPEERKIQGAFNIWSKIS